MKNYTITLSQTDLQFIVQAIAELPFKHVASILSNLQNQVVDQDKKNESSE